MHLVDVTKDRIVTVPLSIPQVELFRNDYIALSSIKLDRSSRFRIRWINLHIVAIGDGGLTRVNSGLGYCFVGVYRSTPAQGPVGVPLFRLGSDVLGCKATNPWDSTDFTIPGIYTTFLVNNTSDTDLSICVTGVGMISPL